MNAMHRVCAVLRFVGCWLGPALFTLAIGFAIFPPAPFGDTSKIPALASAIISSIAWLFARGAEHRGTRKIQVICALAALSFWGWRQWEEIQGYTQEAVTFDNRGASLAATLYLPNRADKVPGIVWVHGSGPQTRNLNASFVSYFARSGFAVLIFDKRGVGESTGHFEFEHAVSPDNIDLLASDASAALSILAKRPEVRADMIGFVGVSQAGWITPRAAAMNGHAAFMLLLSGPVTSTHTQMRYENFHLGPPASESTIGMAIKAFGRGNIPDGMTPDQADALAQKIPIDLPYADYDPMTDLSALDIPALWLLGDRDWMVPSAPTEHKLEELRKMGKSYEYRNIPGAVHAMFFGPRALILNTIDTWFSQVIAKKDST